jgi:cobalt-zinc-cadmium efflux system protein
MADALHMLTDAAALGLAFFAVAWSRKHADDHRTFGYGRMQVLAAFINGLVVLGLAAMLSTRAIRRFWHPVDVHENVMLWVALVGLVVNLAIFFVLHRSKKDSLNIRAALVHVVGDLLSSAAVVISALLIRWSGSGMMANYIDPIATFVVAALIARSAQAIVRECGHILLEGRPSSLDPVQVAENIRSAVAEVKEVHSIHAWSLTGEDVLLTLHATLDESCTRSDDEILCAIKKVLHETHGIHHSTVQVEREGCADQHVHAPQAEHAA